MAKKVHIEDTRLPPRYFFLYQNLTKTLFLPRLEHDATFLTRPSILITTAATAKPSSYQHASIYNVQKSINYWLTIWTLYWSQQQSFRVFCLVVVVNFWARVACSLALKDACFRMRITLGVVLIRSLVCVKCVP